MSSNERRALVDHTICCAPAVRVHRGAITESCRAETNRSAPAFRRPGANLGRTSAEVSHPLAGQRASGLRPGHCLVADHSQTRVERLRPSQRLRRPPREAQVPRHPQMRATELRDGLALLVAVLPRLRGDRRELHTHDSVGAGAGRGRAGVALAPPKRAAAGLRTNSHRRSEEDTSEVPVQKLRGARQS